MRILYVIHSLPIGGAENIAVSYLLKLKERGEDVSLLEISHEKSFLSDRIQTNGIPSITLLHNIIERYLYKFFPFFFLARFERILSRVNPDVIHFQTMSRFMEKMTFPLDKCAFTFHSRIERYFNNGTHVQPLFERLSHTGLSFIAISSKLEEDIHKIYPSAKCVLIPNGVDMTMIARKRRSKSDVRKELGINDDSFVVGQVGRFDKVKNHLFTIDVFSQIVKKNNKAILVLIGTGFEQEIELIKSRIALYHLKDHVIMLGLREDATSLMSCFDVLIHPSLSESFSLVLIEAQVNNIRCVASDVIPQEVICNKNCFKMSLDAPKEKWAEMIMGKEKSIGNGSISQFDINVVIDKHMELYQQISS